MEIRYIDIGDLRPAEYNPRKTTDHQKQEISDSLKRFGLVEPLVVNFHEGREGVIVGGHQRYYELLKQGVASVPVSVVNLDEDSEKELNIRLNKNIGGWDELKLEEYFTSDQLKDFGFLDSDFVDLKVFGEETQVVEDEAPEVSQEEPKSKLGEVYQLGRHRLMCGDSTKIEDVEKLMNGQKADMVFTSPPYNANSHLDYGKGENKRLYENDLDNKDSKEYVAFLHESLFSAFSVTKGFIFWNVGYNANSRHEYIKGIYPFVDKLHETIIWKKTAMPVSNGITRNFEFVFCFNNGDKKHVGKEFDTEFGIWEISNINSQDKENHRASFPIALPTKGIELGSDKNSIVLDLFGGSGSTLIACEQLNRTCYMMELDEKYCDVIRKRYAKFIGKEDWELATPIVL